MPLARSTTSVLLSSGATRLPGGASLMMARRSGGSAAARPDGSSARRASATSVLAYARASRRRRLSRVGGALSRAALQLHRRPVGNSFDAARFPRRSRSRYCPDDTRRSTSTTAYPPPPATALSFAISNSKAQPLTARVKAKDNRALCMAPAEAGFSGARFFGRCEIATGFALQKTRTLLD